jgi:hypothetical protein
MNVIDAFFNCFGQKKSADVTASEFAERDRQGAIAVFVPDGFRYVFVGWRADDFNRNVLAEKIN